MKGYHNVVLLVTLSIICLCDIYLTEAHNGGINVELIHRDSLSSTLYNPNETPFQRLNNSINRSFNRVNHFYPRKLAENPYPQEEITDANGDFIIKFAIDSNRLVHMGLADTISNMIWLQCQHCSSCYKQGFPIFDPAKSKTYENVPCSADACGSIPNRYCTANVCQYQMKYVSGAISAGDVARETFSLGTNDPNKFISFPKVLFGCGHVNSGITSFAGIVGLGPGLFSLTTQLGNSLFNKFSYCLVRAYESNHVSKLNFGEHAIVSGPGTVSTPLKYGAKGDLYYLNLEGISVGGGKKINLEAEVEANLANNQGTVIIDLATTLTFLPQGLYGALESELTSRIKSERVPSPIRSLKICYKSTLNSIEVPTLTSHFTSANVVLNCDNTFLTVKDNIVCLAIVPSPNSFVYGNLAMRNFLIDIDRNKNVVSFLPTDCSKR